MIYCAEWEPKRDIGTLKSSSPKNKTAYLEEWMSLDTETSHNHNTESPIGWIYQWAFCFAGDIVVGRKPSELISAFNKLIKFYRLGSNRKLIIYVHNLSYDWSYLVDWLVEEYGEGETLAIRSHQLISYTNDYFCFKCSYMLSNKSLDKWSKDLGCTHRKLVGFVDYEVIRYQDSELTARDWEYMVGDVETLHECIQRQLDLYHDSIVTVPLTATGYIRREIRRNYNKDTHNFKRFQLTRLNSTTYQLCRKEFAGGYTHGDRYKAGMTIEPGEGKVIKHRDFRSHYPSQQRVRNFPIGKFNLYATDTDLKTIQAQLDKYCILVDCTITNILIKSTKINFPYLQESKCKEGHIGPFRTLADNGRILSFTGTTNVVFNEHDLYWFLRQYNYQEIKYNALYVSRKGPLPAFMKETVDNFMLGKTKFKELEKAEKDPERKLDFKLSLMKSKNGLNAIYGCSATDPVRNEVTWEDMENWSENPPDDVQGALDQYYNSRNNCMRYPWGCWTTSNARHELFTFAYDVIGKANGGEGIEATGCLYMDTDSIFYVSTPDTEKMVEEYNDKLRDRSEKLGAFIEYEGKKVHYDQFCDEEEEITAFRFLHAKCYAYEDKKDGLKCVIAGVPSRTIIGTDEDDKPIYYTREEELGEIDNLKVGKVFTICGGASVAYFAQQPTEIVIDGHKTEVASCAIISNTQKTLKHECEKHLEILEGLLQCGRHQK